VADNQLQINIGADTRSLEQGLQRATAAVETFDKSVKKTTTDSGKATLALTNLGRVASDAPFGFIAIANNIEPLIQSFQSVRKESGSVGGALKALGSSLAGPGGLLLGFTLVSSAITVAIQKYGSLGGALDALFGKQDSLNQEIRSAAESYAKYNEQLKTTTTIQSNAAGSTQGEISRVQALAAIVNDTTATYLQRNNALQELAKINKTYFGNLDLESVKLGTLTKAVDAYTKATIQSAVTKGFETEIGTANVELNKQENILKKLQDRRRTLQAAPQRIVGAAATVDTRDIIAATQAELEQARVVTELRARIRELNTAIGDSIRQFNAITAPINAANAATQNNTTVTNTNTSAINKRTAALQKAEEKQKSLAKILAEAGQVQTLDFTSIFDVDQAEAKSRLERLGIVTAYRDAFEEALAPSQGTLGRNFTIIPPEAIQSAIDNVNRLRDAGLQAGAAFSSVISPAIDGVFNAIENGQSVIKSLGESFKKLVIDLIKATVKAAAFALVISAASGGTINFGTAFRGALQLGGAGGAGGLRIGGAAAPTFGGVGGFGGGLQLAGQVVFTQRGTDLVGVLNSSNARINRVG
jgi:hypothetical protein